ncbi:uncharacterized protein TNCV_11991 [Trichonephila clavipes]|nr:uncharacterized protein TNCV_11991 [Trichonephila clavipes]
MRKAFLPLKRVKTELRSTMEKEKLNNLMLLCTQIDKTMETDNNDVINDFAMIKARRKPLLYKYNDSNSTRNIKMYIKIWNWMVNEDDIEELIMGHEDELTTEELQEILNEEHLETHRNVSPSEQEKDERGPMPTSAIKYLFKKWADVTVIVFEWHPNQAHVSRVGIFITTMLLITSGKF